MQTDATAPPGAASHRVTLDRELDAAAAAELQAQASRLLTERVDLCLDGGAVERASTAGIQMLLAIDRALTRQDNRLALQNPSPVLVRAIEDLGCGNELQRWRLSR